MSTFFKHVMPNGTEKAGEIDKGLKMGKTLTIDESDIFYRAEFKPEILVPYDERESVLIYNENDN